MLSGLPQFHFSTSLVGILPVEQTASEFFKNSIRISDQNSTDKCSWLCLMIKLFSILGLECKTNSGPKPNKLCVFPFTFQGLEYFECPTIEHNQPWCPTEVYENGSYVDKQWGNCDNSCFS